MPAKAGIDHRDPAVRPLKTSLRNPPRQNVSPREHCNQTASVRFYRNYQRELTMRQFTIAAAALSITGLIASTPLDIAHAAPLTALSAAAKPTEQLSAAQANTMQVRWRGGGWGWRGGGWRGGWGGAGFGIGAGLLAGALIGSAIAGPGYYGGPYYGGYGYPGYRYGYAPAYYSSYGWGGPGWGGAGWGGPGPAFSSFAFYGPRPWGFRRGFGRPWRGWW
jgi:hypothetical protein